jgi:hypothetical protein
VVDAELTSQLAVVAGHWLWDDRYRFESYARACLFDYLSSVPGGGFEPK